MPELPEVETVKRGLVPVMEGRTFVSVKLNRADIRFPFADGFVKRLEGTTLVRLTRRAKFLVAELSSGETLLMHLGMSGRFVIDQGSWPAQSGTHNPKHDHVVFKMSGADDPLIIYNDPRRFGFMELLEVGARGRIDDLGPEPLSNQFNGPALYDKLKTKKAPKRFEIW